MVRRGSFRLNCGKVKSRYEQYEVIATDCQFLLRRPEQVVLTDLAGKKHAVKRRVLPDSFCPGSRQLSETRAS